MTTIVISRKHGCMASDSRMTGYNAYVNSRKVERIGDSLYGGCGDAEAIEVFLEWARGGKIKKNKPKWGDDNIPDFDVVELCADGIRLWSSRCVPIPVDADFWAVGSGGLAAMGAMLCGKTPAEAVEIAKLCDEYTGGDVVVFPLKVTNRAKK